MLFIFLECCHLAELKKKNTTHTTLTRHVIFEAPPLLQSLSLLGKLGNLIPGRGTLGPMIPLPGWGLSKHSKLSGVCFLGPPSAASDPPSSSELSVPGS